MNYLEFNFSVMPLQPATDILIAELGSVGFESFVENEQGVLAYIPETDFTEQLFEGLTSFNSHLATINFSKQRIEQENWNATWEQSFDPITVDNRCTVRAPFHPESSSEFSIEIEPKMSFGTGHHETTHLMIQHLLDTDLVNKSVLDMGCGTSVLAILAEMKGAKPIDAIDIDAWCYENSLENVNRNGCQHISVFQGDKSAIQSTYDVIIANINRNILLNDLETYANHLNTNGYILLSGFYSEDLTLMLDKAESLGLALVETLERNNWVALKLKN